MNDKKLEKLLRDALKRANEVISWYETEGDLSCHDEQDLPEDFLEVQRPYEKAMDKLREYERKK